jgi:hypothetical protein
MSNAQNVAVFGQPCWPEASAWLPIYQTAGLVTINGSTTGASVAPLGPTVFNGTAVPDPDFTPRVASAPWWPQVEALARWSRCGGPSIWRA